VPGDAPNDRNVGDVVVKIGPTFIVTAIEIGLLDAVADVSVIVPVYVPSALPVGSAKIVSELALFEDTVPDAGLTLSQPLSEAALAVKLCVRQLSPPYREMSFRSVLDEPVCAVNDRVDGAEMEGVLTNRYTLTVTLPVREPGAVTVIVPL